jgi:hypothetical protein
MAGKFLYQDGDDALARRVQSVDRDMSELGSSVRQSLMPIIPRYSYQEWTIGNVATTIPNVWQSGQYIVPGLDGYINQRAEFTLTGVDQYGTGTTPMNYFYLYLNGDMVAKSELVDVSGPLAPLNPPVSLSYTRHVRAGDVFMLRACPPNGGSGSVATTVNVVVSLSVMYTNPITV